VLFAGCLNLLCVVFVGCLTLWCVILLDRDRRVMKMTKVDMVLLLGVDQMILSTF
jgi:hypothetical protein